MSVSQQERDALINDLRDAISSDIRKDVLDTVKECLSDIQREAKKEKAPNPNVDRFVAENNEIASKTVMAFVDAQKQGYEPGFRFARLVQATMIHGARNHSRVFDQLKTWGDGRLIPGIERAMELENPKYGGIIVPENYGQEIIELLRPYSVLARCQPRRIPLRGKLHVPQKKAGTQSFWGDARGRNRQASRVELGMVTLDEKALTTVVAFPRRLAELSSIDVMAFLRDEILEEQGVSLDQAWIKGEGTSFQPLGFLKLPETGINAPNWVDVNAALAFDLPIKIRKAALNANSTFLRPHWVMSHDLEALLMAVTVNAGTNPFWFTQMTERGTILGYPVAATSHVPVDGTSNNPTTLSLMDMAQYLYGREGEGFEIADTDSGGYYDENGDVALTFPNGEVAVRVVQRCDFAPRNPKALTIAKRVRTT